jgi:hypothetical protein
LLAPAVDTAPSAALAGAIIGYVRLDGIEPGGLVPRSNVHILAGDDALFGKVALIERDGELAAAVAEK